MPYPPVDGGAQTMHFTTKGLLANNVNVKTLAINPLRNYTDEKKLPEEYKTIVQFESILVDTRIKPLEIFTNLFSKESYFTQRFSSVALEDKIASILKNNNYDIINLEHLYLCKYIDVIRAHSNAKIILRAQNVEYIIWERYSTNIKNIFKRFFIEIATSRLKRYEQSVLSQVDGIIALTKEDSEIFKKYSGEIPVFIVPMGYDYENLSSYDFDKQNENRSVIYHLGAMNWLPNLEAIDWFFIKVLPLLKKSKINATLSLHQHC